MTTIHKIILIPCLAIHRCTQSPGMETDVAFRGPLITHTITQGSQPPRYRGVTLYLFQVH